ncbi:DsrE family protein [Sulfurirhabdus autotrophica]|uniref:Intracellular sulfur oxidation DsrE/DsrF family protein n=1 Tax=Sulfurirhabdus autotrophica TaxID=1706046 RepID=A0A4R3YB36_9PROT|nr:DsrE family protein [Sulfurirhabdus autotrophica]TCV88982.1 intracellular sulfur oxidation DsrE/DsrF family protein [Sulfurirhabdus autotrophica]
MLVSIKAIVVSSMVFFCSMTAGFTLAADKVDEFSLRPIISIEKRQDIRVAYDVKDDVWDAGIGKALYYVRGLLDSYKSMGVKPEQLHISVIMHGATAYWLLKDETYQEYKQDPFGYNPNEQVVKELLAHGVSVEICYSTMKGKGWQAEDLLPGVTIVHDAYTRLIDLQQKGYAYIRF